jgi:hypothetical protein
MLPRVAGGLVLRGITPWSHGDGLALRSSRELVELLDRDRRRGRKCDPGRFGQVHGGCHRTRGIRQVDDQHEIDAAERCIARLQLTAIFLEQRALSLSVRLALMPFKPSTEYFPNIR